MKLQTNSRPMPFPRRGLTLLELVVVMSILAALAAILIPLFPSLLTQAHTSAAATNAGEVTKAVQVYNSQTSLYPNNLDSLIDSTGNLFNYLPSNTMSFAGSQLYSDLTPTAPTANDVAALLSVGVTSVLNMQEGATTGVTNSAWSPTFYPYGDGSGGLATTPTAAAISTSSKLALLSSAAAARIGLLSPTASTTTASAGTYYVFGLGGYTPMQGTAMDEAPVHWMVNMTMSNGTVMSMTPSTVYSRFGLVFQTASGTTTSGTTTLTPLSSAKFVGTVLLTGSGVANASKPMSNFISTQSQ